MDWKTYEEITKCIYEELGKSAGVTIDGYGKDCKIKGKSGVNHQIDVLTSHSDGIHTYRTAIECKYWKESVNKDIIMKVAEIVEDSAINKGVIVSKQGFTPDAIDFAKYKNIGLVELREARKEEIEFHLPIRNIKTSRLRPEIININIILSSLNKSKKKHEEIQTDLLIIKRPNGTQIKIAEIIEKFKEELILCKVGENVERKLVFYSSRLINTKSKHSLVIDGIILHGILTETEIDLKFYPSDQVWLIMKSIFEDGAYTISRRGIINKTKNENHK